ncbi:MAG: hypothetical protein LBJ70_03155 [Holosporales bacterium]|jgi:hypothetical protein|nr:hypothetical protein [Holosporales bacterium]
MGLLVMGSCGSGMRVGSPGSGTEPAMKGVLLVNLLGFAHMLHRCFTVFCHIFWVHPMLFYSLTISFKCCVFVL